MPKISCIQFNPAIGDKEKNLSTVERMLSTVAEGVDLVVLPEFFSTGIDHDSFLNRPEDAQGGETIRRVREWAARWNVNIVAGTVIEKEGDGEERKLYNTAFAIDRNGDIVAKYRKIHLFNYMGGTEGSRITPGDRYAIADFDFGKVGLAICYDSRYPQQFRELARMGAALIVIPTAWCVPVTADLRQAEDIWLSMQKTRAFDNLVYVASANQIGRVEGKDILNIGHSLVASPDGVILANAGDKECAITADIDLDVVRRYRQEYPIAEID